MCVFASSKLNISIIERSEQNKKKKKKKKKKNATAISLVDSSDNESCTTLIKVVYEINGVINSFVLIQDRIRNEKVLEIGIFRYCLNGHYQFESIHDVIKP